MRPGWRWRSRSGAKRNTTLLSAKVNVAGIEETVTDKGYHSGAVVKRMKGVRDAHLHSGEETEGTAELGGQKAEEQEAVYANRRRVRGEYGKSLLRRRGELVERSFAHCYETGAMRRCHLRGQENILKRQLVHVGAFNLSLILRKLLGAGTPREWKNRVRKACFDPLLTLHVSDKNPEAASQRPHLCARCQVLT